MLPCTDNSLVTGDDLDPGDACECRRRRTDGPVASYPDSARYQVPYVLDRRPFAPHRQSSSRDCDPVPICPLVSADIHRAAIPVKKICIVFQKTSAELESNGLENNYLCQVKRIPLESFCLFSSHHLDIERPRRILTLSNSIVEISDRVIRIGSAELSGFLRENILDPLISLKSLNIYNGKIIMNRLNNTFSVLFCDSEIRQTL